MVEAVANTSTYTFNSVMAVLIASCEEEMQLLRDYYMRLQNCGLFKDTAELEVTVREISNTMTRTWDDV